MPQSYWECEDTSKGRPEKRKSRLLDEDIQRATEYLKRRPDRYQIFADYVAQRLRDLPPQHSERVQCSMEFILANATIPKITSLCMWKGQINELHVWLASQGLSKKITLTNFFLFLVRTEMYLICNGLVTWFPVNLYSNFKATYVKNLKLNILKKHVRISFAIFTNNFNFILNMLPDSQISEFIKPS